jgi:hypothetical protein
MIRAVILVLTACSAPATTHDLDSRPAWRVRSAGGTHAIDPGTSNAALLDARGCARCHAAIVDEWAASRHALAWTNSTFQTEYSAQPRTWCANCHAPLATQQRDLAGAQAAQGVDCAACHVRGGRLVSAQRRSTSPHDTIADASFGSPAFCADCHQFTFPAMSADGSVESMTELPMQTTFASFASGPYAHEREGCMTCHGSQHGHAFAGAYDRGMLDDAVDVAWCRDGASIAVTVRNRGAGHTVPTGDVHRHMDLRVWRSSAPEALFQVTYGRRFEPLAGGGKRTISDSTLAPLAAITHLVAIDSLGGERDEPVNLELLYSFTETDPAAESIVRYRRAVAELVACDRDL